MGVFGRAVERRWKTGGYVREIDPSVEHQYISVSPCHAPRLLDLCRFFSHTTVVPRLSVIPKFIMKWSTISIALASSAEAALRFGCSTVSIQRLDPLVEPGKLPSAHVHQIVGGNGFNATMEGDISEKATCTTCTFSEDFSNYWTAVMFFKHTNGSYKRVPIMQNTALPNGINGGMTIYYTQQDFNSNGNQKITAFKPVSI